MYRFCITKGQLCIFSGLLRGEEIRVLVRLIEGRVAAGERGHLAATLVVIKI